MKSSSTCTVEYLLLQKQSIHEALADWFALSGVASDSAALTFGSEHV